MDIEATAAMFGFGAFLGLLIVAATRIIAAYVNIHSKSKHALELNIDGHNISINVSSIDKENPKKLDDAIKAVGAARRPVC